jgi:hypothetical protein
MTIKFVIFALLLSFLARAAHSFVPSSFGQSASAATFLLPRRPHRHQRQQHLPVVTLLQAAAQGADYAKNASAISHKEIADYRRGIPSNSDSNGNGDIKVDVRTANAAVAAVAAAAAAATPPKPGKRQGAGEMPVVRFTMVFSVSSALSFTISHYDLVRTACASVTTCAAATTTIRYHDSHRAAFRPFGKRLLVPKNEKNNKRNGWM